jgi:hypothetical protein
MEKIVHPAFADEVAIPMAGRAERLGRSVAVADVNGDGVADVIAGGYGADVGVNIDAGKTYVVYGSGFATGTVLDLSTTPASITLNGIDAGDEAGFYVSGGDINNDGYDDIIIGAYRAMGSGNAAPETGEIYVVFGGSSVPATVNLASANVIVFGAAGGDRLGRSLASADVNHNGVADLLLGASRATPNGRTAAGKAYVIHGPVANGTVLNLADPAAYSKVIYGATGGTTCAVDDEAGTITGDCPDELGRAISAGDFNGDGRNEIVVSALFANNGELLNAGAVYVIYTGHQIYLPIISR